MTCAMLTLVVLARILRVPSISAVEGKELQQVSWVLIQALQHTAKLILHAALAALTELAQACGELCDRQQWSQRHEHASRSGCWSPGGELAQLGQQRPGCPRPALPAGRARSAIRAAEVPAQLLEM